MVLTPGVSLAMGIRDIINADYLSGAIRLLDAVLVAGCLAGGVVPDLHCGAGHLGGDHMRNPLFQFVVAAFATIFFGVTFQVPGGISWPAASWARWAG